MWEILSCKIKDCRNRLSTFVPIKKENRKQVYLWINYAIKMKIKKRNRFWKNYKNQPDFQK